MPRTSRFAACAVQLALLLVLIVTAGTAHAHPRIGVSSTLPLMYHPLSQARGELRFTDRTGAHRELAFRSTRWNLRVDLELSARVRLGLEGALLAALMGDTFPDSTGSDDNYIDGGEVALTAEVRPGLHGLLTRAGWGLMEATHWASGPDPTGPGIARDTDGHGPILGVGYEFSLDKDRVHMAFMLDRRYLWLQDTEFFRDGTLVFTTWELRVSGRF